MGLLIFFHPFYVFGQTGSTGSIGLSISPLTFELTANPGNTITNKLRVYNPSNSSVAVSMEVEDFTVSGEEGEIKVAPSETETYSLANWINIDPKSFVLGPKEQAFVDFTINIPKGAEPGGHYGSILAETKGIIGEGMTGLAVTPKIGALVLLMVSGKVNEDLSVEEFSAPSFSEYGPINFSIRFKNNGSVHVRPKGFISITDWQGKKVIDIPFAQKNVIPEAVRKIDAIFDKQWLIGRYTATLVGNYGTSNYPIEARVLNFWVFPWKIFLGIILTLSAVIFFLFRTRKRWTLALKILIKGDRAK
ncbi:MAG: DUF916 domain-containing protein [Candidatus Parcubacteria bacterium]|nr:DUF916 domain-containing protein [Candidatus Parcubacteria bacterium]